MSVIDEVCVQRPLSVRKEDRLPIIGMHGANVNHPRQPKSQVVIDPLKTASRENFQE
jgi:hypothetical protein